MHRTAWLTDLHLNFVDEVDFEKLILEVAKANVDSLLIGGDVAEAHSLISWLSQFEEKLVTETDQPDLPIYLVLGNHDFYYGGIASVRQDVQEFTEGSSWCFLTNANEPIRLTDRSALVGHDGWADAREGDYNRSLVMMNDYLLIEELAKFSKQDRLVELHRLGDEAAEHIREQLMMALPNYEQVFVLTHVPPFRAACWYQGTISDDEWAPHFVCQAMGRAIKDVAAVFPTKEITVLCGHTHSEGECQPARNVRVITGAAEYGLPKITKVFDLK